MIFKKLNKSKPEIGQILKKMSRQNLRTKKRIRCAKFQKNGQKIVRLFKSSLLEQGCQYNQNHYIFYPLFPVSNLSKFKFFFEKSLRIHYIILKIAIFQITSGLKIYVLVSKSTSGLKYLQFDNYFQKNLEMHLSMV